MEKIIRIALEAKFQNVDLTNLLEVINATGNAVVATETLLGIYEAPQIPETAIIYNERCNFVSFNKYSNEVIYSRTVIRNKTLYFESQEAADACLEYDTSIGLTYPKDDKLIEKIFPVFVTEERTCSLNTWMKK